MTHWLNDTPIEFLSYSVIYMYKTKGAVVKVQLYPNTFYLFHPYSKFVTPPPKKFFANLSISTAIGISLFLRPLSED